MHLPWDVEHQRVIGDQIAFVLGLHVKRMRTHDKTVAEQIELVRRAVSRIPVYIPAPRDLALPIDRRVDMVGEHRKIPVVPHLEPYVIQFCIIWITAGMRMAAVHFEAIVVFQIAWRVD